MLKNTHPILHQAIIKNLTEEERFRHSCSCPDWTSEGFSALIALMSPELFRQSLTSNNLSAETIDQLREALNLRGKLLIDLKKERPIDYVISGNDIIMPAQNYIKWAASNKIPLKWKLIKNLPNTLVSTFLEFQPVNIVLRTGYKYSREYHRAYYLQKAEELMEREGREMTPTEIYKHPYMQNVLRYLRELSCDAKRRIIVERWLPKICNCKRGRPPKII